MKNTNQLTQEEIISKEILGDIKRGTYPYIKIESLVKRSFAHLTSQSASISFMDNVIGRLYDLHKVEEKTSLTRIMAQTFEYYGNTLDGIGLKKHLDGYGLNTEEQLNQRAQRLAQANQIRKIPDMEEVKKVFVFSRGAIGGDINLTSIVLQKERERMPSVPIVFMYGGRTENFEGLFGDIGNIKFEEFKYNKKKNLAEQINDSVEVAEILKDKGYKKGIPVLDLSTHGLIHGMMPICNEEDYHYFPMIPLEGKSHGQQINEESNIVFDIQSNTYAKVFINNEYSNKAEQLYNKFLPEKRNKAITINFGVGGDYTKAVSERFEQNIVLKLIKKGLPVILDGGFGEEETSRTNRLKEIVKKEGYTNYIINRDIAKIDSEKIAKANLMIHFGTIPSFASLIEKSSFYIGYDSMGQHLAAALKIPEAIVYASCEEKRFMEMWHPHTDSSVKQIFYSVKDRAPFMTENQTLDNVITSTP